MTQAVKMRAIPWWLILIEGIALIILGILFLTNPFGTALAVTTVLGIYWLISGILGIIGLFLDRHNWFWKLLLGILGIVAGVLIIQNPAASTVVLGASLTLWLGLLGIFIGILQIIRGVTGEGLGALILGIISIILGIILLANFWGVTFSLPWALGIMALIGGVITIWRAFRARGIQKDMEAGTDEMTNRAMAASAAAETKMDTMATRAGETVSGAGAAAAATAAAVASAADDAVDDMADAADDMADTADEAMDAVADAADDVVDAGSDFAAEAGAAMAAASRTLDVDVDMEMDAPHGGLSAADRVALVSWAQAKGISQADIDRLMDSPYGDLLSRGKTPQERAQLARELGVDEQKLLTYLNMADLQRIDGVGVVYAYLLETAGVDTVKELATRNPANLAAKLAEVNAGTNITKRVPPPGEVENWVAQAKGMPPALEY